MMGHDGLVFVCLARFALFFFFHFSAYTEKGPGGLGLGLGWVVGSSHFFYFFWNACMIVYGFAWFDRVGFLWEKTVSSHREREREIRKVFFCGYIGGTRSGQVGR